ncbi:unnamed protein product [Caenorhabditis auriculariae]|uniref:Uncharacterized protein n=1 Tax=Caenorhabditis auriculariae TaxID=2777116 RepID=A0A8S1GVL8_9PELO|nr:unnamed protein product [Caenorhabditis auriculariae]
MSFLLSSSLRLVSAVNVKMIFNEIFRISPWRIDERQLQIKKNVWSILFEIGNKKRIGETTDYYWNH